MDYKYINDYNKVAALEERLRNIEQEHYSNSVYLMEALAVGAKITAEEMQSSNERLETQHARILAEKDDLVAKLEQENPNEEDE